MGGKRGKQFKSVRSGRSYDPYGADFQHSAGGGLKWSNNPVSCAPLVLAWVSLYLVCGPMAQESGLEHSPLLRGKTHRKEHPALTVGVKEIFDPPLLHQSDVYARNFHLQNHLWA